MLGLRPTADDRRIRPLSAALALLLAIQLVVVATDPSTAADDVDHEGLAGLALQALEDLDQLDTTDTTMATTPSTVDPSTVTTLAPFEAPTADRPAATVQAPTTTQSPQPPQPAPAPVLAGPAASHEQGCGPTIYKADGTPWECTMSDGFVGSELNRQVWSPMLTKATNFSHSKRDCYLDDPEAIRVADGALHLATVPTPADFYCESTSERRSFMASHKSGMVTTYGKWSQMFGRFEVRARMPATKVKGTGTSFWLWPNDPFKYGTWPISGEIDLMEWYSVYPDLVIPYIHYVPANLSGATAYHCKVPDVENWHTYAVEWNQSRITIFIDDWVCLDHKIEPVGLIAPAPFDQPFALSLTQGLGARGNEYQHGVTPMPSVTVVDHVRVWR